MSLKRTLIWSAILLAALAAACSTPAVTGIKVHLQNSEYQEAIYLADSVIAAGDSLDAELWLWRGKAQGSIRDWNGASESFANAHRLDSRFDSEIADYWFVFYNSAALAIQDGDAAAAAEYLQAGRSTVPGRPEYDQMLGDISLQEGDYEGAIASFERSADLSRTMIADLDGMIGSAQGEQLAYLQETRDNAVGTIILSLYNAGMLHKSLGIQAADPTLCTAHLEQASVLLEEALVYEGTNADILNLLAQIYLLRGETDRAMTLFDNALQGVETGLAEGWLTPEDAEAIRGEIMLTRGVALLEAERYEEAAAELQSALATIGPSYVLLGNLAQAQIMLEQFEPALQTLESALMLGDLSGDERANTLYMKFAALNQLERDSEAAGALEAALELRPDNAEWWEYLASTYVRLNRRADAIEAMEKAEALRGQ